MKKFIIEARVNSTNDDRLDAATGRFKTETRVYTNTIATLKYFAQAMRDAGVKPQLVCWNLPMLRTAGAFIDAGLVAAPAYIYLGMSAASLSHHPLAPEGLAAYLPFLPKAAHEWVVASTGGSLLPFVAQVAQAGGHMSLGLGDHPYGELGEPTNAQLIAHVAQLAAGHGREAATPAQAMAMPGMARSTQA